MELYLKALPRLSLWIREKYLYKMIAKFERHLEMVTLIVSNCLALENEVLD